MLSDPETATSAPEDRVDTREAAREVGLRYVSDEEPGYRRKRNGRGFRYIDPQGRPVTDEAVLKRIKALAIPPAYTDVWICRHANGHIQATGRDDRGRKQYRYHTHFREARESTKFAHMMEFAAVLPALRATVQEHMGRRGLPREKVLATVVHLLETTLIRVGNDDYARANRSYGLTTLRDPHVTVEGASLKFRFKGKSGKVWQLSVQDRRVAKIVKACQDLPGQELFQYLDADGVQRDVTSADVNAYLREISGRDITAKDFRTWSGTVLAALALREFEAFDNQAAAKRNIRSAIERVAERLGNTPTICRKCYIHPEVLGCYLDGEFLLRIRDEVQAELREDIHRLRPEETAVLALLQARLAGASRDATPARNADAAAGRSRKGTTDSAKPSGRTSSGRKSSGRRTSSRRAA
ncbi:DNA topoisomerase IB [Methylobacterium sp. ID0610]|uniref:DNA topoisomerase IB n=1 Tax=Methylobacterium carpenticola TaxID=3344827 RepID=UPI0036A6FF5C